MFGPKYAISAINLMNVNGSSCGVIAINYFNDTKKIGSDLTGEGWFPVFIDIDFSWTKGKATKKAKKMEEEYDISIIYNCI